MNGWGVAAVAVAAGVGWGIGYARRRLLVVTVRGGSMAPTLREGDRLLVRRCGASRLARGDLVVIDPPEIQVPVAGTWRQPVPEPQVKRVAALGGDRMPVGVPAEAAVVPPGALVVTSDDPAVGVDSRQWGPYPAHGLIGKVVRRLTRVRTGRSGTGPAGDLVVKPI